MEHGVGAGSGTEFAAGVGVGNGCLAPRQEMIRAEVAQMLMNYLK